MAYSIRSYLSKQSYRSIYSTTGIWEQKLTAKIKKDIEKHWHGTNKQPSSKQHSKDKMYVLSMFPYPSGNLHMGHIRVYTLSDLLARYYRVLGKNVIHPIGWDAFGLPAENAAKKHGHLPHEWTYNNIANMKEQLKMIDCSFDWDKEIATCNTSYYKWTQYIFLKMFERGLVYQDMGLVNWDPVDKTVLADEQVDDLGCSWRSGAEVEKRVLKQWFVKTSKLAKSMSEGLNDPSLSGWQHITKIQKNWIGECNGWRFEFRLQHKNKLLEERFSAWTSSPELLFGLSFIAVRPDHYFNNYWKYQKENEDVKILNVSAIHPYTGSCIPLIVSPDIVFNQDDDDFYLGIPCNSEEDSEIAIRLKLPIVDVLGARNKSQVLKNSNQFSDMDLKSAREKMCNYALENGFGGYETSPNRRDWLISRQRYWGTPIPLIHCDNCKIVPVPYNQLPVELPKISKLVESKNMTSPLSNLDEWVQVKCPKCGNLAKRETDTIDTFFDSTWYFLRYLDSKNELEPFNKEKIAPLLPVDIYIGGAEHALLHLFSSRFVFHFFRNEGLVPCREPFQNLLMMGMMLSESFKLKKSGQYLHKDEVELKGKNLVEKSSGEIVEKQWEKMSKSKFNGVDPKKVIEEYGLDTTRLYVLAEAHPTANRRWDLTTIKGIYHWEGRMWFLVYDFLQPKSKKNSISKENCQKYDEHLFEERNYAVKKISHHLNVTYSVNIAIKLFQRLTNHMRKVPREIVGESKQYERCLQALIVMLAPFAPHLASELWTGFKASPNLTTKQNGTIWDQEWPKMDSNYLMDLVVRINGRDLTAVKMSREDLDNLDKQSAIKLTEMLITDELKENYIMKVLFTSYRDFDSEIDYILIPKRKEITADRLAG